MMMFKSCKILSHSIISHCAEFWSLISHQTHGSIGILPVATNQCGPLGCFNAGLFTSFELKSVIITIFFKKLILNQPPSLNFKLQFIPEYTNITIETVSKTISHTIKNYYQSIITKNNFTKLLPFMHAGNQQVQSEKDSNVHIA